MERKPLPKSFIWVALGISLLSFLYVNVDAQLRTSALADASALTQQSQNTKCAESQPSEDDDQTPQKSNLPNVAFVAHLLELAKKIVPGS